MKWKNRRQSKNVKKASLEAEIAGTLYKEQQKQNAKSDQVVKGRRSTALRTKDLKRHKDTGTDILNEFNMKPDEQQKNVKRLRQLQDTAKPKHLIPATPRRARLK